MNTLHWKLLGPPDNLHLALKTGQTHFKRNGGLNMPTTGGVLSPCDPAKGHGKETSQPGTAH